VLPDTATKQVDRRWPRYALAAMGLAALLLGAALLREQSFTLGEELYSPGFKDVAVSTEDTSYPTSDVQRFDRRPKIVYVYLAVEDLPSGRDLKATLDHSRQQSVLFWLLAGGDGFEVTDGQEDHMNPSGGGVSGVVKFAVRAGSGERLPAGDYTVSIYTSDEEAGAQDAAARKYFAI
jgi:hypothetical protein